MPDAEQVEILLVQGLIQTVTLVQSSTQENKGCEKPMGEIGAKTYGLAPCLGVGYCPTYAEHCTVC